MNQGRRCRGICRPSFRDSITGIWYISAPLSPQKGHFPRTQKIQTPPQVSFVKHTIGSNEGSSWWSYSHVSCIFVCTFIQYLHHHVCQLRQVTVPDQATWQPLRPLAHIDVRFSSPPDHRSTVKHRTRRRQPPARVMARVWG